jgi:uncharacterized integral membrane protein (TIGR00697 family)
MDARIAHLISMKNKEIEMSENKTVLTTANSKLFPWLLTIYITLLLVSNIVANRLTILNGSPVTSAMYLFGFSYIIGDILPELFGYAAARRIIWFGVLANLIMVTLFLFISILPIPDFFIESEKAYSQVLGVVPRVVVASLVGYFAGSFSNAIIMSKMKAWMISWDPSHKFLFLRTIGSTVVGEFADSMLFGFIAFLGVMPVSAVFTLCITQWIVKTLIEAAMTPVTYLVVNKARKYEGIDMVATSNLKYNPFSLKGDADQVNAAE